MHADERGAALPAGADEAARLKTVVQGGRQMEHYTNIHRIECLARGHPLVANVTTHKVETSLAATDFDANGRAIKRRGPKPTKAYGTWR